MAKKLQFGGKIWFRDANKQKKRKVPTESKRNGPKFFENGAKYQPPNVKLSNIVPNFATRETSKGDLSFLYVTIKGHKNFFELL